MLTKMQLFRIGAIGLLGVGVAMQIYALATPSWSVYTLDKFIDNGHDVHIGEEIGPFHICVQVEYKNVSRCMTWESLPTGVPFDVIYTRVLSCWGAAVSTLAFILEALLAVSAMTGVLPQGVGGKPALTPAQEKAEKAMFRLSFTGCSGAIIGAILWLINVHSDLDWDVDVYDSITNLHVGSSFVISIVGGVVTGVGTFLTFIAK